MEDLPLLSHLLKQEGKVLERHTIYLLLLWGIGVPMGQAATAAEAEPPYWMLCTMETSGGAGTPVAMLVVEPFPAKREKGPGLGTGIGSLFDKAVGTGTIIPGYRMFASFSSDTCRAFLTEADALAKRDQWKSSANYRIVKFVEWRPGAEWTGIAGGASNIRVTGSAGGPGNPADKSGATVEAIKSPLDPAWNEQILAEQRRQAANAARAAALALRNQVKEQAETARLFDEMRKRGRAQ
ncbi:hypothetical protein [Sphingopyxis sp. R3-92]|uniref:hypothetical protein n=1 Tax=Sphingopyxis sp. R3-92 TaxID=3158553 RepID=UPI003EE77492